jgi:hypothetical protein
MNEKLYAVQVPSVEAQDAASSLRDDNYAVTREEVLETDAGTYVRIHVADEFGLPSTRSYITTAAWMLSEMGYDATVVEVEEPSAGG